MLGAIESAAVRVHAATLVHSVTDKPHPGLDVTQAGMAIEVRWMWARQRVCGTALTLVQALRCGEASLPASTSAGVELRLAPLGPASGGGAPHGANVARLQRIVAAFAPDDGYVASRARSASDVGNIPPHNVVRRLHSRIVASISRYDCLPSHHKCVRVSAGSLTPSRAGCGSRLRRELDVSVPSVSLKAWLASLHKAAGTPNGDPRHVPPTPPPVFSSASGSDSDSLPGVGGTHGVTGGPRTLSSNSSYDDELLLSSD